MQLADAVECIKVVMVLQVLVQRFLEPRGLFPDESASLLLLSRIIRLLRSGDRALGRLSLLRDLIKQHHEKYKRLYPMCVKPKLHYLSHTPDVFQWLRGNYSCFTPERKHRWAKRMASHSFKTFHRTLLHRLTRMGCQAMKGHETFIPYRLEDKPRGPSDALLGSLRALGVHDARDCMLSSSHLKTPRGILHKGDLLGLGSGEFGLALGVLSISDVVAGRVETRLVALVDALNRITPLQHARETGIVRRERLVRAQCLLGACIVYVQGDVHHVVLSPDTRDEV